MDLDRLDAEHGGPMGVLVGSRRIELPAATSLSWRLVVAAAESPHYFVPLVWPADVPLTAWKLDAIHQAWVQHNGLPSGAQLQRLVYMMEKFGEGIEYDLQDKLGLRLGELWRGRLWRELLTYIDHLPSNTHMNRLLTNDEEYMRMVLAQQKGEGSGAPSMSDWSPEVAAITALIDAVRQNTMVTQAVASNGKGAKPTFTPEKRPTTVMDKVRRELQRKAHDEMVAALLPDRSG